MLEEIDAVEGLSAIKQLEPTSNAPSNSTRALTFAAITVTAMSEIDPGRAGIASGLMTTGHELGAALGQPPTSVAQPPAH